MITDEILINFGFRRGSITTTQNKKIAIWEKQGFFITSNYQLINMPSEGYTWLCYSVNPIKDLESLMNLYKKQKGLDLTMHGGEIERTRSTANTPIRLMGGDKR